MKTIYSGKVAIQLPLNCVYTLLYSYLLFLKFWNLFSLHRDNYLSVGYFFQKHELGACKLLIKLF